MWVVNVHYWHGIAQYTWSLVQCRPIHTTSICEKLSNLNTSCWQEKAWVWPMDESIHPPVIRDNIRSLIHKKRRSSKKVPLENHVTLNFGIYYLVWWSVLPHSLVTLPVACDILKLPGQQAGQGRAGSRAADTKWWGQTRLAKAKR